MLRTSLALIVFFSTAFLPALSPAASPAPNQASAEKLKTETLRVGGKTVVAEIADTDSTREKGLMFRKKMGENEGMLFVFERDEPLAFWMKNTLIPLAIGYFDSNRKLIEVHEMVPASLGDLFPRSYPSSKPARYALEMNKGWYTRHNVRSGALLERGTSPTARTQTRKN